MILAALALAFVAPVRAAAPPRSVLVVGWDGADRRRLRELFDAGRLPNLAALVSSGTLVDTRVTTGATETKPGWAEIWTGRSADDMGIEDNRNYRPIPKGATVFERAKEMWGTGVCTAFVSGKVNNVGARGPHEICVNCATRDPKTREKTAWWDRATAKTLTRRNVDPRWVSREGEPFFNARSSLDVYRGGLPSDDAVVDAALESVRHCGSTPFVAFVHFERPDEDGHRKGEDSSSYLEGFLDDDRGLGRLLTGLSSAGRRAGTVVVVTTDHGMNPGKFEHSGAPDTWLASDVPGLRSGDRKDVGATLLDLLGLDAERLPGRPLTSAR